MTAAGDHGPMSLGHEDGSVQARYSHITARMSSRLMDELTEQWKESLAALFVPKQLE
ncbi:hypothetical protein [Streptomyces griseoluteus]|uniref:hypothetical protein n=1 Tax=Streptomyces griseoluteus TaxID=29306 RepID=UPI0036FDF30F